MQTLCVCDKKMLEPRDTTFVSEGRPCCTAKCYWYAEGRRVERQLLARTLERREQAARHVCVTDNGQPDETVDDGSLVWVANCRRG